MRITLGQYFGSKPHSAAQETSATDLLTRVNSLVAEAVAAGKFVEQIDPDTGTTISGSRGGSGDGGFRLPTASTGKPLSSHKDAKAVDKFDPANRLDAWLTEFDDQDFGNSKLAEYGLYREHPTTTDTWCHLTTRPPGSGRRTFYP